MSEEIKKQETMDDFAQEIEASFSNFRDADMEIWDKLEQMKEWMKLKTVLSFPQENY